MDLRTAHSGGQLSASLTTGQMRRAVHATRSLTELSSLERFPVSAAEVLRELIPCEHCAYDAIDLKLGKAIVVANPRDAVFDGGPEALAQLGHQNPIIVRGLAGDHSVQRLSDYMTRRQLHRTQLYRDVYRHISLEYQLGVRLPNVAHSLGRASQLVGLSVTRNHRDFSEADKLLLALLRPHFAATLERLHQIALARAVVAGVQADHSSWVLLVDREDVVAWASDEAEEALGVRVGQRLVLDPHLTVHRVPNAYPSLDALRVARASRHRADALRRFGLTTRQSEVLEVALRGLSAQQIADTLSLSRRTVEKHFEAIYAHLGVSTRAEAIAAVAEHPKT